MRVLRVTVWVVTVLVQAAGGPAVTVVQARPPDANPMHLTSPLHGKVESISASNISVTSDKGPVGNFNIGPGTKILRDGKQISATQVFKGVMMANQTIIGTLPPESNSNSGSGGKKKKNQ